MRRWPDRRGIKSRGTWPSNPILPRGICSGFLRTGGAPFPRISPPLTRAAAVYHRRFLAGRCAAGTGIDAATRVRANCATWYLSNMNWRVLQFMLFQWQITLNPKRTADVLALTLALGWCWSAACCCSRWMSAATIWARVGLARRAREYRPDPAEYADLTGHQAQIGPRAPLGTRVFAQHCAVCHGPNGAERGPAAPRCFHVLATSHPADSSTSPPRPASRPPTRISCGRSATACPRARCPYFSGLLSTEELNAVVAQVKSYSSAFSQTRRPIEIPARSRVRRKVWPAERRCLSPRLRRGATATPVAAASVR